MTQEVNKPLLKTIGFWALIVAIAAGIIIPILFFILPKSADFQITLVPNIGEVDKGSYVQAKIIVEGQKYSSNIKLTTKSQNDKIDIVIDPSNGIATPKFESNIKIKVASNIEAGDYELEIVGIGAKNKIEHSTNYFLTVKNPPYAPQQLISLFYPDGFMGDVSDINLNYNSTVNPYSGNSCIQIDYSPRGAQNWAGIYWLYPNHNWGNKPEGRNLTGAKTLTFMAKGSKGGEIAEFKIGGVSGTYSDSFNPAKSIVTTLTNDWKEYSIDLKESNLSNVIGGFCWVTNTIQNSKGCIIYLDDITFK